MAEAAGSTMRTERVLFETDRQVIVGDITLPPEGYQSRFSDAINRGDVAFIPIVNVEITPLGGGDAEKRDFIVLAKSYIRLAHPIAENR
jgi:hypothetical protein